MATDPAEPSVLDSQLNGRLNLFSILLCILELLPSSCSNLPAQHLLETIISILHEGCRVPR